MWIIWQEFRGIVSDGWDKIVVVVRQLRDDIAANYQLIIVTGIGLPISVVLTGIPIVAVLDLVFVKSMRYLLDPRSEPTPQMDGNPIGLLLMLFLGISAFSLTVELASRVEKRLEGKPKSDDQPSPTKPESEA